MGIKVWNTDIKNISLYIYQIVHVTWVSLNKNFVVLDTAWQTEQLTATITPANADDQTVSWSSSNQSIATVSNTGLVTCVAPWDASITVMTNDGWYIDVCLVSDQPWWQPWIHTIAYYPLTTNGNDSTSNHNDLTVWTWITFSSNGAYFPWNDTGWLLEPSTVSISFAWSYTILWWQKSLAYVYDDARWIDIYFEDSSAHDVRIASLWSRDNQWYYVGNQYVSTSQTQWTWYLNIITINNGIITAYNNGSTQVWNSNTMATDYTSQMFRWGQEYNHAVNRELVWYIKDIIIEDRLWTTTEMDVYFEQNKWDYWY